MNRLADRIKNRIISSKAFTLAEALVAILIVLLVSSVVAAGIPAAINAYDKVVMTANSHVLLSTATTALRNELITAKNVETADSNKTLLYYNEALGTESKIYAEPSTKPDNQPEGTIMLQRYANSELIPDAVDNSPQRLVSEEASDKDKGLYIIFDSVTCTTTADATTGRSYKYVTFNGLLVKTRSGRPTSATLGSYSIKLIADVNQE